MNQTVSLILSLGVVIFIVIRLFEAYWITTHTIMIDPSYHHLGDKPLEFLEPNEPEGTQYTNSFFLPAIPPHPYLSIRAKDVDQNLFQSGVIISVNQIDFTYLNFGFQDVPTMEEHMIGEREVTIPIPAGLLKAGMNAIEIRVVPDPYTGNIDDIQFRELKLIHK